MPSTIEFIRCSSSKDVRQHLGCGDQLTIAEREFRAQ